MTTLSTPTTDTQKATVGSVNWQPQSERGNDEDAAIPTKTYITFMGLFALSFGAAVLVANRRKRALPERVETADIVLLGVATHKLSRIITADKITRPLRAPFAETQGSAGAGELDDQPVGEGTRRAVGELLTCPFCVGAWIAAGFSYGMVFAPGPTRLAGSILTVKAISDGLNIAYTAAKKSTERLSDG